MTDLRARAETFANMQQSYETKRAYGRDLRLYFEWLARRGLEPTEVTEDTAVEFRDYLVDMYTPNGAARVWNTVRNFHRFARYPDNPFEYVKPPKRTINQTPKVPSDEDVELLVDAASQQPQRALIVALLLNGLRASEVTSLLKADVEQHEGATVLRVIGKGQKERLIPATIEVERAMVRFFSQASEAQKRSPYVVSDYGGSKLTYRQVEHAVYKSAEYAGVEGMHPHALRHHYATRLIRAGVSELHVQKLLGHASVATTQMYVGLNLGDLIAASRKDPRNAEEPVRVRVVA
jgi:site-specific recombinase XerD